MASAIAMSVLVSGCATTRAQGDDDVRQLQAELASQRRAQRELLERIERLETRVTLLSRADVPPPASQISREGRPWDQLPVVRLAPRHNPVAAAPRVDTSTRLREPSEEEFASLMGEPSSDLSAFVETNDEDAEQVFGEALRLYHSGDLTTSRAAFEAFAERYPRHRSTGDALYLAGMARVQTRRCELATELFQIVVDEHPGSSAVRRALLAMGQCEAAEGRTTKARELLRRVVREHPRTPEAAQAESALQDLSQRSDSGRPGVLSAAMSAAGVRS